MVDHIDTQVGRVLAALEETGQLERTLIIYTSDHGEMLGDHGLYLKGPYFYEAAVRVPLILSGGGITEQGHWGVLVQLMDLAPTILDAAGAAHPPGMQGKSLWSKLTGIASHDTHWRAVYSEYYNAMPFHADPKCYVTMVADAGSKLVLAHGRQEGELYDFTCDPGESWNRFSDPSYKDLKIKMLQQMCDRMACTADPLPEREARH
jgi:arylsulfatase A-like enzyme